MCTHRIDISAESHVIHFVGKLSHIDYEWDCGGVLRHLLYGGIDIHNCVQSTESRTFRSWLIAIQLDTFSMASMVAHKRKLNRSLALSQKQSRPDASHSNKNRKKQRFEDEATKVMCVMEKICRLLFIDVQDVKPPNHREINLIKWSVVRTSLDPFHHE